ncbi:Glycosyltransferase involved in cell wall bisynthesis [Bryocella elongata]|uniref:Glycosyltransferase involved in cell wall bisynthesis n=2 Tax=Bryocella elongata TaxID=863522 RepID=A0A1H5SSS0_9BACT|nr:Glycosyltransferase involved in cell wall bisynthesis [Bryocella elongata]
MAGLQPSGMEMMFLSSAREWSRHGVCSEILATAPEVGPLAPRLIEAGYAVHHLPFRSSRRYLPSTEFVTGFQRLCRDGRFDVVHLHTEEASPLFALLARSAGVRRLALTMHNSFHFTGKLRARKIAERAFLRLMGARFGFVSDAVAANEAHRFHNRGVRITNWVDTARFRPPTVAERQAARQQLGLDDDTTAILTIGNCNEAKNHGALLEALALLPTGKDLVYLHVGREQPDAPERSHATALGISDRVRFAGSQADVLPWLWASDLFAMPSLHEGLAIAPLEAIAAGCPALLTSVDGLAELATAASHAVFSAPAPNAIAEALGALLARPAEKRRAKALIDSSTLSAAFSPALGVASICRLLYGIED